MPGPITLTSPLAPNDLLFESMTLSAGLSMLDETQLGLVSAKPNLKAEDLLGKPVTVTVHLQDDARRHFHGYVTRFGLGLRRGSYFGYQASVRPWLWFLTRTADCRIFQNLSVPDIVKTVFHDHGTANFEFKLFRNYRKWVYCVQYRESDYNFIARLLEHEGIYWYIEHGEGQGKVVLVDSQSAHDAAPHCDSLPFYENGVDAAPDLECVSSWSFASEVETDTIELASYDFERPSASLKVDAKKSLLYPVTPLEMFDFQGDYVKSIDGSQWAEDRLDEHQTRYQGAHGASNAQGIEVGRLLQLARHPRDDQNERYLVTGISLHASVDAYESGGGDGGGGTFQCDFSAIPATQQFRPPRRTPKPFVQGPQTAIVVGPAGEEVYTDRYGRVKVQFHWDRLGKKDDKSSCWVRVSNPWAGKNFGAVHVPRIGQEVVVSFLEGDPDQPLVTGRVYNAEHMPPWDLPANATQSGILTRSSKGGSSANANALRFEDKKGSEQLWIHAERNQDIEVEADETHWVGHDRKKTVDHDEVVVVHRDRTERVDRCESISIGRDRQLRVEHDKSEIVLNNKSVTVEGRHLENIAKTMEVNVGTNLSETVGFNHSETVGAAMELTVGAALAISVGAAMIETVGGVKAQTVGGSLNEAVGSAKTSSIGGSLTQSVNESMTLDVGANLDVSVSGKHTESVSKDYLLQARKIQFRAEDELSIKVGDAEMVFKKNGDVTLNGARINLKGSGDVSITGSKVAVN